MKSEMPHNHPYDQALRLIRRRACEGVSVEDHTVEPADFASSTLDRSIQKSRLGHTPAHELMSVRLAHAKEFLTTTDLPLKRIARLVGCRDLANFYRFFRSHTGMAPGEFRDCRGLIHTQKNFVDTNAHNSSPKKSTHQRRNDLSTMNSDNSEFCFVN